MMTYLSLSALFRSFISLWNLLLCLGGLVGIVNSAIEKKYKTGVFAGLLMASAYFLWQTGYDLYEYHKSGTASPVSLAIGNGPFYQVMLIDLILSLLLVILFRSIRNHQKEHITAASIKQCADRMNCGICCWNDNGRVVFSNNCMNRICEELTGNPLLNGFVFQRQIPQEILTIGEENWKFSEKEIPYQGRTVYELTAINITEMLRKTQELRTNTEKLFALTEELKELNMNIDEAVRREEILRAKINIHDEMNRLMLITESADLDDEEALNTVFSTWEKNTLLLCMDADRKNSDDAADRLEQFSTVLGIELTWKDPLPELLTESQRELFYIAAREALTNAAKHANASQMRIRMEEKPHHLHFFFENDGKIPCSEVRFSGGLANLARLARSQNAAVSTWVHDTWFVLSLIFEKGDL